MTACLKQSKIWKYNLKKKKYAKIFGFIYLVILFFFNGLDNFGNFIFISTPHPTPRPRL